MFIQIEVPNDSQNQANKFCRLLHLQRINLTFQNRQPQFLVPNVHTNNVTEKPGNNIPH